MKIPELFEIIEYKNEDNALIDQGRLIIKYREDVKVLLLNNKILIKIHTFEDYSFKKVIIINNNKDRGILSGNYLIYKSTPRRMSKQSIITIPGCYGYYKYKNTCVLITHPIGYIRKKRIHDSYFNY